MPFLAFCPTHCRVPTPGAGLRTTSRRHGAAWRLGWRRSFGVTTAGQIPRRPCGQRPFGGRTRRCRTPRKTARRNRFSTYRARRAAVGRGRARPLPGPRRFPGGRRPTPTERSRRRVGPAGGGRAKLLERRRRPGRAGIVSRYMSEIIIPDRHADRRRRTRRNVAERFTRRMRSTAKTAGRRFGGRSIGHETPRHRSSRRDD